MFKFKKQQIIVLKIWIPFAIVITCLCGLIYLSAQQNLRLSANDPQIQIAEDIANQIMQGESPLSFIPPSKTDLAKSLATYIMLFDKDGKLIDSSVALNGQIPSVPKGIFASAKSSSTNEIRFTWQPAIGIRSAVVIDYYKGSNPGYVLIGRSLKEIEIREDQQLYIALLAWAVTMLGSFFAILLINKLKS